MKVGILTFHAHLNYGGVLQCLALQKTLESLGHEAIVVDRWMDIDNFVLERNYNIVLSKEFLKSCIRLLLGLGDFRRWLRVRRTKKFVQKHLKLTPYHFVEWKDAPGDLGLDLLVVGSDQVWHCGNWGDPSVYLLDGAPQIRAISYAASFGMTELPDSFVDVYLNGLSRFSAISCREHEGVDICRGLGFAATHVVDPTLLAWCARADINAKGGKPNELVCYFLSEKLEDHIPELSEFAKRRKCKVRVFLIDAWLSAVPLNISGVVALLKKWRYRICPSVEIMDSAGPQEFFDAFRTAKWVVSDSFHALMFSICNGCNARIIRPKTEFRIQMFSRIEEFAQHTRGPLIVDSVSSALDSIASGEEVSYDYSWIKSRCNESISYLKNNLK